MNIISRVPVLRIVSRIVKEITEEAPYEDFGNYEDYWEERIRDKRHSPTLDRYHTIEKRLPPNSKVLDIGCGDGAFLKFLRSKRPDCTIRGADISAFAVERLRRDGVDAQNFDPDRSLIDQFGDSWDYIVLMEVIEHIVDAESLVHKVKELNLKGLFITIPNAGFILYRLRLLLGGRFPITTIIYHMKEHVRFWTVSDFIYWSRIMGLNVRKCYPQIDRGDAFVRFFARLSPSLFARQVVYEITISDDC